MLFGFKKIDSLLYLYSNEKKGNSTPLISFLFKNQIIIEQTQTIPLTIYKHPTLYSTEYHSKNIQ